MYNQYSCYTAPHQNPYFPDSHFANHNSFRPYPEADTSIFGENWSDITVQNRSGKKLEVLWIGVGWHCLRGWYGIMP